MDSLNFEIPDWWLSHSDQSGKFEEVRLISICATNLSMTAVELADIGSV